MRGRVIRVIAAAEAANKTWRLIEHRAVYTAPAQRARHTRQHSSTGPTDAARMPPPHAYPGAARHDTCSCLCSDMSRRRGEPGVPLPRTLRLKRKSVLLLLLRRRRRQLLRLLMVRLLRCGGGGGCRCC